MSRSRFAVATFLYALLMAYAGTIVGPVGLHFVPIDPAEALQRFIHMPFVANGSDQRSDWMGNLMMAVPLGFLTAGWFSPRHSDAEHEVSTSAAMGAFILSGAIILTVKYLQLFFPPRTVTLNYVTAQGIGACIGIVLLGAMRSPLAEFGRGFGRLESLRVILRIYTVLLILFMLMPLDFALSADDLATQFARLPDTFTALGGDGRPFMVQIALLVASIAATAPIGALLTLEDKGRVFVGRSTSAAAWIGFFIMLAVYVATTLVISGAASMPAIAIRTIGIALGARFMHWLTRRDPEELRYDLGDRVPILLPVYVLVLLGVNGLLSLDWNTPSAAAENFYRLGLLPLFDYYIVTKAQAAKNIVGHIAMYAPLGVLLWLRAKDDGGRFAAFVLAASLSAIIEIGRFLRPGLVPDINAVPLAGISAWCAAALMPVLWEMVSAVALGRRIAKPSPMAGATPLNWRERDTARRVRGRERIDPIGPALGDVEDY